MTNYRVVTEPDSNGTLLITCPQIPQMVTFADDEAGVAKHAADALETILAALVDDGADIPRPTRGGKGIAVPLPLLTRLKLELYWALREAGITRAELARRLGWNRESVDRLFRIDHRSRPEQLEAALNALGQRVDLKVGHAA